MGLLHPQCGHDDLPIEAALFECESKQAAFDIAKVGPRCVFLTLRDDQFLIGQLLDDCPNLDAQLARGAQATMALSANRKTLDTDREFAQLRTQLLGTDETLPHGGKT